MLQLLRDPAAIEKERKEAKEYLGQTDSLTSRMRSGSAGQKSGKFLILLYHKNLNCLCLSSCVTLGSKMGVRSRH